MLVVNHAIRHFKHVIKCVPFNIQTNHQTRIPALTKTCDVWSTRHNVSSRSLQNQMVILPKYQAQKTDADVLLRVTINDVQRCTQFGYQVLPREQQQDTETDTYTITITNLNWQYVSIDCAKLLCDVSTGVTDHWFPKVLDAEFSTPCMDYPNHQCTLPSSW